MFIVSTISFIKPAKKRRVSDSQLQLALIRLSLLNEPMEGLRINRKLELVVEALGRKDVNQQKDFGTSVEGLHRSDARMSRLEQEFRAPRQDFDQAFQTPNMWLTLGFFAEHLKSMQNDLGEVRNSTQHVGVMDFLMSKQVQELHLFAVDPIRKINKRIRSKVRALFHHCCFHIKSSIASIYSMNLPFSPFHMVFTMYSVIFRYV